MSNVIIDKWNLKKSHGVDLFKFIVLLCIVLYFFIFTHFSHRICNLLIGKNFRIFLNNERYISTFNKQISLNCSCYFTFLRIMVKNIFHMSYEAWSQTIIKFPVGCSTQYTCPKTLFKVNLFVMWCIRIFCPSDSCFLLKVKLIYSFRNANFYLKKTENLLQRNQKITKIISSSP